MKKSTLIGLGLFGVVLNGAIVLGVIWGILALLRHYEVL